MSTLMLDFEVYEAIATCLDRQHIKHGCNKITLFDCSDLTRKKINELMKTWCDLNEWSYVAEYKNEEEFDTLSELIDLTAYYTGVTPVQLYKWLGALIYNIDIPLIETITTVTEEQRQAFSILQEIYRQLANTIIHGTEEYAKAYYSSYPAENLITPPVILRKPEDTKKAKKTQFIEMTIQAKVQIQSRLTPEQIRFKVPEETIFHFNLPPQIEAVHVTEIQTTIQTL